ncbi:MAG TPA: 4a-hydroxytetrahydrobiopterin dehydratase [Thermoanaerobaculia bacterium]|nr:4a-hydroxytetrahydrobiopterin dehydratase [Thermoanaerobaculia bacterium]
MPEVLLYTRANCHLCDVAKDAMARIAAEGVTFQLREIDIDQNPGLKLKFGNDIPVIYIGGVEAMRHRVDADKFRRLLAAAPSAAPARELAAMTCVPCRGGVPPMTEPDITRYLQRLGGGWEVVSGHHLRKEFRFRDFAEALAFTNRIGAIAEEQGHHPDIELAWGRVGVAIWTHKIDGLTESDFVLAAKIDKGLVDR